MVLKFFTEIILLLKVDYFEGILNQNKIDEMVNDHLTAVTRSNLKKLYANIDKKPFVIFSHSYQHNH